VVGGGFNRGNRARAAVERTVALYVASKMKVLFILNDPPYGTERVYNGLRLAGSLARLENHEVKVFLMGDAASCAKAGQKVPSGYY